MAEGWISLHRKFLTWEWFEDTNMVKLFVYLLLKANHKPDKWRGIDINRGQLLTGLDSLNKETKISKQTLRTCLKRLENTKEINTQVTNKYRIITICNYDSYQDNNNEANSQTNNQLTINQQSINNQLTANNNVNNINKENKEIIDYLNLKAQRDFKYKTSSTKTLIAARFKDGFTFDNFKTVIDIKTKEWLNTDNEKYLRPETLFGNKFDSYLNSVKKTNSIKSKNTNKFTLKAHMGETKTFECDTLEEAKVLYHNWCGALIENIKEV